MWSTRRTKKMPDEQFRFLPKGKNGKLYYDVTTKTIRAGVSQNKRTGEFYPSIELSYGIKDILNMTMIAEEMQRQRIFPEVFIENKTNPASVVVIFHLRHMTVELFVSLIESARTIAQMGRVLAPDKMELVVVSEAEFAPSELIAFIDLFEEKKFFNLFIRSEEQERPPVWGSRLVQYINGYPKIE